MDGNIRVPYSHTPMSGLGAARIFTNVFRRYNTQPCPESESSSPPATPTGSQAPASPPTSPGASLYSRSSRPPPHVAGSGGTGGDIPESRSRGAQRIRGAHDAPLPRPRATPGPKHHIRFVPHLDTTRYLSFTPVERDVYEYGPQLRIGRYTRRAGESELPGAPTGGEALPGDAPAAAAESAGGDTASQVGDRPDLRPSTDRADSTRVMFKSKVVSRMHAEIWCESGGTFFVRDTRSSSGTFLNHTRLSPPNVMSRPFPLRDGDVLQFGVDYQGGAEDLFRCVKLRVETDRDSRPRANAYNVAALRQLHQIRDGPRDTAPHLAATPAPPAQQGAKVAECCICLFDITVCQALFVAPCSHLFHYKCIRPLLNLHHPGFLCPLCRSFADLEANVETDEGLQEELQQHLDAHEQTTFFSEGSGSRTSGSQTSGSDGANERGSGSGAPAAPAPPAQGAMPDVASETMPADVVAAYSDIGPLAGTEPMVAARSFQMDAPLPPPGDAEELMPGPGVPSTAATSTDAQARAAPRVGDIFTSLGQANP